MRKIPELHYATILRGMQKTAPERLVKFYWDLGVQLNKIENTYRSQPGRGFQDFLEALSLDLRRAQPEVYAFSYGSLSYMSRFAYDYPQLDLTQPIAQLPWGNITRIMTKIRKGDRREQFAAEAAKHQWSMCELEVQIEKFYGREKQCKSSPYVTLVHDRNIPLGSMYKSEQWSFSRDYHWKSIFFETYTTDGRACLSIAMRHHLSLPKLINLLVPKGQQQLPGVRTFHDGARGLNTLPVLHNIIRINFHLNQNGCDVIDSPTTIKRMLGDFVGRLKTTIPHDMQQHDFKEMENGLYKAYEEYLDDCQKGFPGLDFHERTAVPRKSKVLPERAHVDEMWRAITANDDKALQELYKKGFITPEFKQECLFSKALSENDHQQIRALLEKRLLTEDQVLYGLSLIHFALKGSVKTESEGLRSLQTFELLLFYRVDLLGASRREDAPTALEQVLHICDYSSDNPIVLEYCKDIIRRLVPNENNASNIVVCDEMKQDPIGKLVHELQLKWNKGIKRAPNIKEVLIDSHIKFKTQYSELSVEPIPVKLLSKNELDELFELFKKKCPQATRRYFDEEIIKEEDAPVWIDRIFLDKKLVGYTVSDIKKITSSGKQYILYHASLAVQYGIPKEYGPITGLILLQRGFVLQERNPSLDVLTVYDVATLEGFSVSEELEPHPKYFTLDDGLLHDIREAVYPGETFANMKNDCYYIRDSLADISKPDNDQKEPVDGVTYRDITRKYYRDRFFTQGASLVMIFQNNEKNLLGLAKQHNQNLASTTVQGIIKRIAEFQDKEDRYTSRFTSKL